MTRLLVTGATGFIGSGLLAKLSDLGYQVCGVSRSGGIVKGVPVDVVSCASRTALASYCRGKSFDGVVHLAAAVPTDFCGADAKRSMLQNARMTMNVLEILGKQGVGSFIYASSTSVYGYPKESPVTEETPVQPAGFYPLGKFVGELLCQQYQEELNLPVAILRISAPYGPGMRRETVVTKFVKKAILSEDLTLYGTGSRGQDFIHRDDVTNAIVYAFQAKATGRFNVSTGVQTSMKKLAETILRVVGGSKSRIAYAGVDDPQESYRAAFSFEKARRSFGYQPEFPLARGVEEYAKVIRRESGL